MQYMAEIIKHKNIDKAEERLKIIFRTSIIAIGVNVALGIFKALVGFMSNSIAITMDAVNNFTDAGSSFITILSSYFATKDADKKHPFGYGRIEYLGTLLIAILISYAGVTAFIESVKNIITPQAAEYSKVSLFIIVVAVIAKTGLTIFITRAGKRTNSDSLIAAGKESVGDIALGTKYVNQIHGFYLNKAEKVMRFDMVISFDAADRRQVHDEVIKRINEKYPEYQVNAVIDTDYNEI